MAIVSDKKYAITGEQLEDLGNRVDDIKTTAEEAKVGLDNKVDKVQGKGLSTEDYTSAEKQKLSGIETGAEENIIEEIDVNGTKINPNNKIVDISVPLVENSLTSESTTDALSAAQGKTLKTLIDNIPSGVTELTEDDYNWPENNPQYIAMWKFPYGTYKISKTVSRVYPCAATYMIPTANDGDIFMSVSGKWNNVFGQEVCCVTCPSLGSGIALYDNHMTYAPAIFRVKLSDGSLLNFDGSSRSNIFNIGILDASAVVDDLVHANYPRMPLSAKQGYILNTNIGNLSSLTTTAKTSTVAAINELVTNQSSQISAQDWDDLINS